jgi:hypothetical protein
MARVPCVLCLHLSMGESPAELHHIRTGSGAAQRAEHYLVVPLCPEHHRGRTGVHGLGVRGIYLKYKLDELDLLAMAWEQAWRRGVIAGGSGPIEQS